MNLQMKLAQYAFAFVAATWPAYPQVTIDSAIRRHIGEVLQRPVMVYQLDLAQNKSNFDAVDKLFTRYIKLDKASRRQSKVRDKTTFGLLMRVNVPISPTAEITKGVATQAPFNVFYIKEPQKRIFFKELSVPTRQRLSDEKAIALAKEFISRNRLYEPTKTDALVSPNVILRKRHESKPDLKEEEKLVLYQRVEFKREIDGVEVMNSKQIVDLHPDSGEVISYRSIKCTPIDEASGKKLPYVSDAEIVAQIRSAFEKAKTEYRIEKVRSALYQTDKRIIPVLVVYTKQLVGASAPVPEESALVIPLVKDAELEGKKRELRRPTESK